MIQFSKNILMDLEKLATTGSPAFSTERGDLFVLEGQPTAAIKLKVSLGEYLEFLQSAHTPALCAIPVANQSFQIVVNGPVMVEAGETYIADKKTVLL